MITIADIKEHNRRVGLYFFEPATIRFFRSRVLPTIYQGNGRILFLTSEEFRGSMVLPRRYTVREYNPQTGNITTVGEFNKLTKAEARKSARQLTGKRQYNREAWQGPGFAFFQ